MSVSWSPSRAVTGPITIAGTESLSNSETTALLARMTTQPSLGRRIAIDNLIGRLKLAGVWTKLDALYVLAAHEQASAILNWVSTSYNLTTSAAPTFTANRYIQGNGTTQFYDTGFDPTVAVSPKYVQNSAHFGFWQVNTVGGNPFGHTGATITPSTTPIYRINGAAGVTGSGAAATGYFTANRTSASAVEGFWNGVSNVTAGANTSATPSAETFYICARNQAADTFATGRMAIVHFGQSLTAGEVSAAYAAFNGYLAGIGAV